MTKLEKIEEIIREYEIGSDPDTTAEDIIEGIKNTLDADDRYFDREVTPRTAPSDEIDFDKELIFDSLSLEGDYFDYSTEPYCDGEMIDWAFTVNSSLERKLIERGGYNKEQLAARVGDEYVEGLHPLDYDDVYAEQYLIVDKDKNITIENHIKREGSEITTCGDAVLSPSESKALCGYIDKYLAQNKGKSIDKYLEEGSNLYLNDFEINEGVLIKYTGIEEHVVVPEGVDQLGKHSFSGCKNLKSITLPRGLKLVHDNAFAGCTNLESVAFNDGLKYIGERVFMNCYSLDKINIPDSVKQISREAFICCENLKSVSIPQNCSVNITAFPRTCNVTRKNSSPQQSRELNI